MSLKQICSDEIVTLLIHNHISISNLKVLPRSLFKEIISNYIVVNLYYEFPHCFDCVHFKIFKILI